MVICQVLLRSKQDTIKESLVAVQVMAGSELSGKPQYQQLQLEVRVES